MVSQLIRIFPCSTEEFDNEDELRVWLHTELRLKDGDYYLRTTNGVGNILPGGLVLFRFCNHIIGEAVVKEEIKKEKHIIKDVTYAAMIKFEASSIRIYRRPIVINELNISTKDLSYARAYNKIEWSNYFQILAKVVKYGFF